MLSFSGTLSYAAFVYLCICVFVFACLADGNIIFDTLEYFLFQNTREDSGTKVACANKKKLALIFVLRRAVSGWLGEPK